MIGTVQKNESINTSILYIAVLCVPLMLLVKPIWIKLNEEKHEVHDETSPQWKKGGYSEFEDEDEPVTPVNRDSNRPFEWAESEEVDGVTELKLNKASANLDRIDDKSDSPMWAAWVHGTI